MGTLIDLLDEVIHRTRFDTGPCGHGCTHFVADTGVSALGMANILARVLVDADMTVVPALDSEARTEIDALIERWRERRTAFEAARHYGIVLNLDHVDVARDQRAAELLAAYRDQQR